MRYIVIICFLFLTTHSNAQFSKHRRSMQYVSLGYPLFDDSFEHKKILLGELGYQKDINRFLAWEVSLSRSSANSIKKEMFGSDEEILYYMNQYAPYLFSNFAKINTYALGAKVHLSILNNKKHYLSFSPGIGVYSSKSKMVSLNSTSYNILTGDIVDYKAFYSGHIRTKGYFRSYSLQYYRFIDRKLFIGSKLQLVLDQNYYSYEQQPVYPTFWGLTFTIGKYFN